MEAIGLNWFDAVVLGVIVISGIMAFARGLLREVFSIVAFVAAALAALYFRHLLAPALSGVLQPAILAEGAAAFIIFLVVFIAVTLATSLLAKAVHQSAEIGALDRFAGAAFGLARGILIMALLVLLMRHITGAPQAPMPAWMTDARVYPVLEQAAVTLEAVIPQARSYIREKSDGESPPPDARG